MRMQRTIWWVIVFAIYAGRCQAQAIIIFDHSGKQVNNDTLTVAFHPNPDHGWTEIYVDLYVKNNSDSGAFFIARKSEFNLRNDEYHSICFAGFCFDSSVYTAPYPAIINARRIDSSFSGNFRFDDLTHPPGLCVVAYTFYHENDNADSAIVYVRYDTKTFTGLAENQTSPGKNFRCYPNPATGKLFISFDHLQSVSKLNLSINNSLGQAVLSQVVTDNNNTSLDISAIPPGIYLLTICDGAEVLWNERVVVCGD